MASKKFDIDTVLANIEKAVGNTGEPAIRKAETSKEYAKVPGISFGYPEVDEASNCGGVKRGTMVEIFGPESGGKSFLTLKLIGSAQKDGVRCCLVDAESSYDPVWAEENGVDTESLYIIDQSMSAEKTLDYVAAICESGAFGLVVIDSTAALIPQKELDGSIQDQDYALLARAMSKGCRKIMQNCKSSKTTCVFINQIRDKMGVMFGDTTTTPGGRALKFYCHQRIKVAPGKVVKIKGEDDKDIPILRQSWVTFVKNKVGRPFGQCVIEIVFDKAMKNPMVKLCKSAKEDAKLISTSKGELKLKKTMFEGAKTNVETGTTTLIDLADYLIKNDMVNILLDAYIVTMKELNKDIDAEILLMKEDPSTIISPLNGAIVENSKHEDIEDSIGYKDSDME
jgi:recombination protein RecA